ncbi:cytochrome P450 alkane hydroxylase [Coccidioides immitis RS]|uniref:Cytochrome P450 alkane hydroxylase n=3 Tax=Coccidioides immitis TaxID=5501 RepID=A0A0E1S072_COCIM|nr:cytochrome P450 alkane hydroxylase [Coccidioides immitis RS]EAS35749.1 cytochrome P450 alkane hydroxylase [Coccidioides immitis RS]KMP01032.1 cytochrome P450 52A11 [Coccidioides immitis RMSCC 2394]KMU83541.1 cytochrome P450 52A11 [Coccidioides immitis H538.4]TPX26034.1 hypothetical protein DIZ76_011493 [Coccidioides immitis]
MLEELVTAVSPGQAVLIAFGLFATFLFILDLKIDWRIQKLGPQAPRVRTYLPLGADFIYRAMKAAGKQKDLEFWTKMTEVPKYTGPGRLSTFEVKFSCYSRSLFTIDPDNIKAVLTGQFADYGKGRRFHEEWRDFLGDSIFATDGELWSKSRQLIRPMFSRDRIVDTEIFEKHIHKLIPLLGGGANQDGSKVVDVGPLFFRFTLDAATDYLLGQSVDSLDNPKTTFAESFQYVLHRQSVIFRSGPLSPLLSRKLFHENLKKMDDFMQPFIEQVRALTPEELDHKLSKKDTFLHALARFTRDPTVLRDQLVAILLAGRDTTAATLSFCIFELSRHPAVVQRLRNEIETVCGNRKPTYSELKEMKYLNAVLNETMRLYPVVPFNVRHALVDTTLPRGGGSDGQSTIGVPADTRIVYSTMAMQRRRDLYPPPPVPGEKTLQPYFDPLLFHPERWLSGWQPKPWHFIPFNGGPRICLGQQFATIEMGYTVTRILQHYPEIIGVGAPKPGTDPKFKFDVTLSPGQRLDCVFVKKEE